MLSLPCPSCGKSRTYKTKVGYTRAYEHAKVCKSCSNSLAGGGIGAVYKDGKRYCIDCADYLTLDNFNLHSGKPSSYCKPHENIRSSKYNGKPETKISRKIKTYKPKTEQERLFIILGHGSRCALCDSNEDTVLDHDHTTGQIRGYLCGSCNRALGLFKDDPNLLIKASEYLKQWKV